jgi:hypothetical protein
MLSHESKVWDLASASHQRLEAVALRHIRAASLLLEERDDLGAFGCIIDTLEGQHSGQHDQAA